MKRILALLLCGLLLTGCASQPTAAASRPAAPTQAAGEPPPEEEASAEPAVNYIQETADAIIAARIPPDASQEEKARLAYEYLIETTAIARPVGLDIWRYRGAGDAAGQPSFLENRGLSPLVFGVGSCEDYAAALAVLLGRMGMEAVYVPGLTVSAQGGFVDHAWTMAKIGGTWYHLDPHLEDTILKENRLTYKYFMKSDQTMLASHRWGENLLAFGVLTPAQAAEVRDRWLAEECPVDFPTPPPLPLQDIPAPDPDQLERDIEAERERYAREHGAPAPLELELSPPVFHGDTYPPGLVQ